jgi:predicted phage terminase large subunit-like protein
VNCFNESHPNSIGIEENAFQYDTVQTLQKKTLLPIKGVRAIKNKTESFQTELAPYFENGQIYIRDGLEGFITELLNLPVGEFDDQADALKIAIKTSLLKKLEPRVRVL